jgi:CTD kinase subunit gamma
LQQKSILSVDTVVEIEACLKERDTLPANSVLSPIDANGQREQPSQNVPLKANGVSRPDKRQIEQRIEEDRERHKRLRESIWAVKDEGDQEFERLWDEASDVGDDDYLAAEEDALERRQAVEVE